MCASVFSLGHYVVAGIMDIFTILINIPFVKKLSENPSKVTYNTIEHRNTVVYGARVQLHIENEENEGRVQLSEQPSTLACKVPVQLHTEHKYNEG
jgi:hypothetical protein